MQDKCVHYSVFNAVGGVTKITMQTLPYQDDTIDDLVICYVNQTNSVGDGSDSMDNVGCVVGTIEGSEDGIEL